MRVRRSLSLRRLAAVALLSVAALTPTGVLAQDATTDSPAVTPAAEPPAAETPAATPAPAAAAKSPFRKGIHRLRLNVGYNNGASVRDAGILTAPLTGEPGQPDYPAASSLSVNLEGGATLDVGYTYFFNEKWGLDLGLGYFPSKIVDTQFDLAEVDAQLATTALGQDEKDHLRARMIAHAQPHDLSVMSFDVNATRVFKPTAKWPLEIAAGLGWAGSSLGDTTIGDRVVYERLVASTVVDPQDSAIVANDIPPNPMPYVEAGCLADNDPCMEMTEKGGMTWNLAATVHHAFTDKLMLDLTSRIRVTSQALDPGDEYVTFQIGAGISFLFGAN